MNHDADSELDRFRLIVVSPLKRLALLQHVPASECDDCVQEALLALLRTHPEWALDEPRTSAWLRAVVLNHARLFHRLLRRRRTQTIEDMDSMQRNSPFAETDREPGQYGEHSQAIALVRDSLDRLTETNRDIFIQRAVRDLAYTEIAEKLGLTSEAVRLRFSRIREKLRLECVRSAMAGLGGGVLLRIMPVAG